MKKIIVVFMVSILTLSLGAHEKGAIDSLRESGKIFAKVAKKVSPAVVLIKAEKDVLANSNQRGGNTREELLRRFFRGQSDQQQKQEPQKKQRQEVGQERLDGVAVRGDLWRPHLEHGGGLGGGDAGVDRRHRGRAARAIGGRGCGERGCEGGW